LRIFIRRYLEQKIKEVFGKKGKVKKQNKKETLPIIIKRYLEQKNKGSSWENSQEILSQKGID
jgi:hypothetical protein